MDIVSWSQSKFGFYVDRRWRDGGWHLERGPIRLADYHGAILAHVLTPNADGRLPYDVIAWCEPAKSGKSAIAGLCAEYAALHLDGDVILASNKRSQAASLMFKSLTDSIEFNPTLHVEPNRYEVEFANGNTVLPIASNSRGEAGARFSLALFDELWGYIYTDAERLWSEFKTDPTRQCSMRMAVGYGGYDDSVLWREVLEQGLQGEPVPALAHIGDGRGQPACWRNGRHFTFWSHETKQPWQTPEWVESQRQSLRPAEFSRIITTDFVAGMGDFLPPGVWEGLVNPDLEPLQPGSREPISIGLDLAVKPGGDDAALCALYGTDDGVAVAFHTLWKGGKARKSDLQIGHTVKPALIRAARDYNVQAIAVDPWQCMGLAQELRAMGLPVLEVAQTHSTRGVADTVLYQICREGTLALYPDPELTTAAAHASAKELGDGKLFITKAGRGTIDLLIAMSNALVGLAMPVAQYHVNYQPVRIGGW